MSLAHQRRHGPPPAVARRAKPEPLADQPARQRVTVTARPGDTLWSIADEHRGDVAITRYVDALVDLNGGASIQAGQAIVLP